ncbi:MAG TPA: hypothetical protein VGZ90_15955 [Puia sp.]|nr:hypothetical protein [Puia sp.]
MEVHHHPDLHHRKKKWKEYLLEFLMIFLAVTLGFFAETIREKISEKHRENDYIVGLINNIQSDTSDLTGLINRNDLELSGIDSIMKISKKDFLSLSVQDSIFYYGLRYTFNLHLFQFNDLTLVQLRNAGGYSLIKTSRVADSIALYESKNNDIKIQERFVIDNFVQTMTSFKQILDITLTNKFFQEYETKKRIPSGMYVLISKDEDKMYLLYNNYWIYKGTLSGYNIKLKEHLEYLTGFIKFLKRNYDIE